MLINLIFLLMNCVAPDLCGIPSSTLFNHLRTFNRMVINLWLYAALSNVTPQKSYTLIKVLASIIAAFQFESYQLSLHIKGSPLTLTLTLTLIFNRNLNPT